MNAQEFIKEIPYYHLLKQFLLPLLVYSYGLKVSTCCQIINKMKLTKNDDVTWFY